MRLLAGDLGGTKTRLQCVEADGSTSLEGRYDTSSYLRFDDLLRAFLAEVPGRVDAACFAVAGPVRDGRAELTNRGWVIEERNLTGERLTRVTLLNDFSAIALGVPLLPAADLHSLHRGARDPAAPIAILGAGTGLGEAIVITHGGEHHVVPTEGGHADFAPQDEEQARLFLFLHEKLGHVSWERLLSGMGLQNIFEFLGGGESSPSEIADRASAGDDRARHAVRIFVDIYGAEAGNMGLRLLARGGIYLAGGIAAKNIAWFTDGRFVEAFRRKGRFSELMETIPVDLIANEEAGLLGALEGARRVAKG
jgi:glucokinase